MALKLGEMLVENNIITEQQLQKALHEQKRLGVGRLGYHLVRLGLVEEDKLTMILGKQFKVPIINLSKAAIPLETIQLVPKDVVVKHQAIPVKVSGRVLTVVISNPHDQAALAELKAITQMDQIVPIVAAESAIKRTIDKYYERADSLADLMSLNVDGLENLEEQGGRPAAQAPAGDFAVTLDTPGEFEQASLNDIAWSNSAAIQAVVQLMINKGLLTAKEVVDAVKKVQGR